MTVTHQTQHGHPNAAAEGAHQEPGRVTREDALKFLAAGHRAEGLRARAAETQTLATIARDAGDSTDDVRALVLALADALDELEAEGMTPAKCWDELGWSLEFTEQVLRSRGVTP